MPTSEADAQTMLDLYIAAEKAVLRGQSYTLGQRTLTRADLEKIRKGRQEWQLAVDRAAAGGIKLKRVVPRDT